MTSSNPVLKALGTCLAAAATFACAGEKKDAAPPAAAPAGPPPQLVSVAQFKELSWLHGKWRGSGGNYPSFFEQYESLNDSTIQMRAFKDSTLRVVTDSSTIALRGNVVQSRGATSAYEATVSATTIRFVKSGTNRGHTFTRVSNDEWTATLDAATADGKPTVYVMKRIAP
jgi:hypothetical protein